MGGAKISLAKCAVKMFWPRLLQVRRCVMHFSAFIRIVFALVPNIQLYNITMCPSC